MRATDGRAALIVVTLAGDLNEDEELAVAHGVEDIAHGLDSPEVLVGGTVLVGETFQTASESDLLLGEAIALPIAILSWCCCSAVSSPVACRCSSRSAGSSPRLLSWSP